MFINNLHFTSPRNGLNLTMNGLKWAQMQKSVAEHHEG